MIRRSRGRCVHQPSRRVATGRAAPAEPGQADPIESAEPMRRRAQKVVTVVVFDASS